MVFGGPEVSVIAARSTDEALAAAKRARPDLVIADVTLASGSGYDLCVAIKADGALHGVPVYILASAHNPYDSAKAQRAGVDGQFQKPFESQSLIDQVNAIFARGAAAQDARVSVPPPPSSAPKPALDLMEPPIPPEDFDDEYGEFKIEGPGRSSSPTAGPTPASRPTASTPALSAPPTVLRPSLIPGARPGIIAPHKPSTPPVVAPSLPPPPPAPITPANPAPLGAPLSMPQVPRGAPMSRTMMGFPTVIPPGPTGAAPQQTRPAPPMPLPMPTHPSPPSVPAPLSAPVAAAVDRKLNQKLDEKMSQISAKGPEYEAIAKLSREIIEQVVWEVVPELAEVIIRQEVDRLANAKR